jgi:hypothetical protein
MLKRPVGLLDVTELRKWCDAAIKRMAPASVKQTACEWAMDGVVARG